MLAAVALLGFRQAGKGTVHEKHDQAVGNQHQEGSDEEGGTQRFRGFADQRFT